MIHVTDAIKATLLEALDRYRGDNLERAEMAFAHYTPEQSAAPYGYSSDTPAQILEQYRSHARAVDEAAAFVRSLPTT